jgi:hypothetical protein
VKRWRFSCMVERARKPMHAIEAAAPRQALFDDGRRARRQLALGPSRSEGGWSCGCRFFDGRDRDVRVRYTAAAAEPAVKKSRFLGVGIEGGASRCGCHQRITRIPRSSRDSGYRYRPPIGSRAGLDERSFAVVAVAMSLPPFSWPGDRRQKADLARATGESRSLADRSPASALALTAIAPAFGFRGRRFAQAQAGRGQGSVAAVRIQSSPFLAPAARGSRRTFGFYLSGEP